MAWDRELEDLMAGGVTVSTGAITRSLGGVETWSTGGSTYKARVTRVEEEINLPNSITAHATHVVWVASTAALSTGHRVVINGSTGDKLHLLKTEAHADEDGPYHQKLWFGYKR